MASANKTQRWLDLLAALLVRRFGATFDELSREVPGYRHNGTPKAIASAKRAFERDKDALRAFGVPIESHVPPGEEDDASAHRYVLRAGDFYLPFVAATLPGMPLPARPARGVGYQALRTVTLALDELEALARAGDRARSFGDPVLAMEAEEALRKLAFDQPLAVAADGSVRVVESSSRASRDVHEAVTSALRHRKRLAFTYRSIGRDASGRREVQAYGLVLQSGHWYLVARDTDAGALRLFRLSRMSDARLNAARPNTPDYEIPGAFDLAEHARSREAWELGDGDATAVVVRFKAVTGAVRPALAHGVAVRGRPRHRRFHVRRTDAFVRWLLSFAGAAVPVSPPALVAEWRGTIAATAALYTGSAT